MSAQPTQFTIESAEAPAGSMTGSAANVAGSQKSEQPQTITVTDASSVSISQGASSASHRSSPLRIGFGALLLVSWIILTIVWVASTIYSVGRGHPMAAVTAFGAVALLVVLGAMEGLEVSVIDRWQKIWPGRPTSSLARWLAARQFFVASIVTAATLLANRAVLVIPGTSLRITDAFVLGVFDLAWTSFTVLWFAQIMPKHLGAVNPDRYLDRTLSRCFPIVEVVRVVGVSQPGEWMAYVLEYWFTWPAQQRTTQKHSLAAIWCTLREDLNEVESGS